MSAVIPGTEFLSVAIAAAQLPATAALVSGLVLPVTLTVQTAMTFVSKRETKATSLEKPQLIPPASADETSTSSTALWIISRRRTKRTTTVLVIPTTLAVAVMVDVRAVLLVSPLPHTLARLRPGS